MMTPGSSQLKNCTLLSIMINENIENNSSTSGNLKACLIYKDICYKDVAYILLKSYF